MPITFNEDTQQFEGDNAFGQTLAGFDFAGFGGLITNNGLITNSVTATSDAGIEMLNSVSGTITRGAGEFAAVDLLGNGGRLFSNDGVIDGGMRLGNGWDTLFNTGEVTGPVDTGNGNDLLTNQIISLVDGGGFTVGTFNGTVRTGDGNDTVLNTGVMHDVLLGAGNDTYSVGGFQNASGVMIDGQSGDVRGDAGNDVLNGGDADERFYGGADDDQLNGAAGRDKLYGDAGNDTLNAGDGNDKLYGGAGNDVMDGGRNNDRLFGEHGNDLMDGGHGNDLLNGGAGDDVMSGGAGNDRMFGGDGNDRIEGGQGRDTMYGGKGADVFVFAGQSGRDTIVDFTDGDQIALGAGIGYDDITAHLSFVGGNAVIDLSAIATAAGQPGNGAVLTVNNVSIDDLDAAAFGLFDDVFIAT